MMGSSVFQAFDIAWLEHFLPSFLLKLLDGCISGVCVVTATIHMAIATQVLVDGGTVRTVGCNLVVTSASATRVEDTAMVEQ